MTKAPITLQDLRRKLYVKAKAEPSWRFWGLYVHICKLETLQAAYAVAKANDGAPGTDGVTFEAIEAAGVEAFLMQLRDELATVRYQPMRNRRHEIPKDGGTKVRVLSIPAIRDRVVQGAVKLILEPIFEADFQPGSWGYRPKRTAQAAVRLVADAIKHGKTHVIDLDLRAYFDNVRHDRLLEKVAQRINDDDVMHLLKLMLKATGDKGVPQGGVVSPLLSNVYLNTVDRMLEHAKASTRIGNYTAVEYARFADDLVILVDAHHPRHDWLFEAVQTRLREELAELDVEVNEEKTRLVDMAKGESFGFLGFDFRRVRRSRGGWWVRSHAEAQKADGAAAHAGRHLSAPSVPTGRKSHPGNQSHLAGLGELLRGGPRKPLLLVHSLLGRTKGAAAFDAECEASRRRLATVASGVDVPNAGSLRGLSRAAPRSDSGRRPIGLITLDGKQPGKLSAGNPHAQFEVAGTGNGVTATSTRARRGKPRIRPRSCLRITAPVPDPTQGARGAVSTSSIPIAFAVARRLSNA